MGLLGQYSCWESAFTSPGTFPPRFARMEKSFDSQAHVKQFTCLAPQLKKTLSGFFNWGATGNRTQIEGSTNLSVNRYTITPIYNSLYSKERFIIYTRKTLINQSLVRSREYIKKQNCK
ncbi:MAG: hypothetical protein QG566_126 [Patescibacteria group bacterium]|nr:hypothetical protein [Patescibacteria group bacterium]